MSEQIIAAATAEQRAILAPHVERMQRARQDAAEAEVLIRVAMRALWPESKEPGVEYDIARGLLVRKIEGANNGKD